ncbi:MAG: hypothetical protein K2J90_13545 [Lachnospiraceae bacterium]|nr:hypothetical protein [Lachnospiraceae bacterium]
MKLIRVYILFVATVICFTGCANKEDSAKKAVGAIEMTSLNHISASNEEVGKIIKSYPNFKISESLSIDVPLDVKEIFEYKANYSIDINMKDYDSEFMAMYEYLFPNHPFDDNYLFYYGGSSDMVYDDNTGELIEDYHKVKDWHDEIISGKEGKVNYLYDETWHRDITEWEPSVCLEIGNPIGYGYAIINKGRTVELSDSKIYDDMLQTDRYPILESYDPVDSLEYIATYSPDSTKQYKLADQKISICNAVNFFEKYINSLPFPKQKNAKTVVVDVDVYQVNKRTYGYNFLTTKEYQGIRFDHMRAAESNGYYGFDDYSSLLGSAFMVESKDVDILYGYYQSENMEEETNYQEIITLKSALKTVSEKLTDYVEFAVRKIELVYTQKYSKTEDGYIDNENMSAEITPAWKITLDNPNDNLTYICYINAVDGGNFRYCTTPTDWWEDDGE